MTAGDSVTGRGATIAVLNPAGSHQRTNRGVARVYIIPDSRVPQVPNVGIVVGG
jgi:hypothetical protein